MFSVPLPALSEELAASTLESHRGNPVLALKPVHVGFHDAEQPRLLVLRGGSQRCDDELGIFGFDEVMNLDPGFGFRSGFPVQHRIRGGLDLVQVADLLRVRVFYRCS
jgi:hypothetical protein